MDLADEVSRPVGPGRRPARAGEQSPGRLATASPASVVVSGRDPLWDGCRRPRRAPAAVPVLTYPSGGSLPVRPNALQIRGSWSTELVHQHTVGDHRSDASN
jgi:hypothetical protein